MTAPTPTTAIPELLLAAADGRATAIGSFPFADPEPAIEAIFTHLDQIPTWPQLPARSTREGFFAQYVAPLPGIVADWDAGTLYLDTDEKGPAELEAFYEKVLSENLAAFALRDAHASGFAPFVERLRAGGPRFAAKGHVTGPISFGLGLADQKKRAILYNETFFEAVRHAVRLQAAWQIETLRPLADHVILFADEPHLMNYGSAFSQFGKEQAIDWINDVADEAHKRGGLLGVHCCGNTDWSILYRSRIDIVNFDAFGFFDSIFLYPDDLAAFVARGGVLAAGIVPTNDDLTALDAETLAATLIAKVETFDVGLPVEQIAHQTLITPSCGLGTCAAEFAVRALETTAEVSRRFRARFGL